MRTLELFVGADRVDSGLYEQLTILNNDSEARLDFCNIGKLTNSKTVMKFISKLSYCIHQTYYPGRPYLDPDHG